MPRGESARVASYFEQYAAMGPERSLAKLCTVLGKVAGYRRKLEEFSSKYGWQVRVRNYDQKRAEEERERVDAARRERLERLERERIRMDDEQALLGRTHALRAAKVIAELIEKDRMTATPAVALLKVATDIERMARGAETERRGVIVEENHENTLKIDLSRLTLEQLERLEAIAEEIDGKVVEVQQIEAGE